MVVRSSAPLTWKCILVVRDYQVIYAIGVSRKLNRLKHTLRSPFIIMTKICETVFSSSNK